MIVDARATLCPYPVVELGRAAQGAAPGSTIHLLADDPVALMDVPAWCRMRQAELTTIVHHEGYWEFVVITPVERPPLQAGS